ncbi:ABC transporter ATP-binding protein [Fictibacillus sp. UD]|uniref:ABC transporter ATP-binding protein n=1 Tax=Fictibacillus sp. UD TaxID=3038777 RepID=UPI003745BE5A
MTPILEIKNLSISLRDKKKMLIKNMNLCVQNGQMLGLVGESGSGKSLTATAILGLLPSSLEIVSGTIQFGSYEITSLTEKECSQIRGKEIAYLPQNYQSYFTPFIKIGHQLVEIIRTHTAKKKTDAKEMALYWLNRVNLPAERVFNSYPYQLSGGQLQRASLAAAIMFRPKLIIADEPTTALDVVNGEIILDLLRDVQQEMNCAVLLISHDLKKMVNKVDELAVMYGGHIAEIGKTRAISNNPVHPYTHLLFQSSLKLSKSVPKELPTIHGEPGLVSLSGCSFLLRCPYATEECSKRPQMKTVGKQHLVACHSVSGGLKKDVSYSFNYQNV